MNVQRDPDAILAAWLDEGPTGLPEPTRRAIAVNTRTTTQRRRPVWMPPRRPLMNTYARWAVAAIAVVLAIGGAAYFLAPAGGQFGGLPNATPSASSSSSWGRRRPRTASVATPSASPAPSSADGFVYPGTYIPAFDPGLTFTIDREVQHNCAPGFECRGSIDVNLPGLAQPRVRHAEDRGACRARRQGQRPGQIRHADRSTGRPRDWIASRPGVTVTAQKTVQVGGLAATQLDVQTGNKDLSFGPIPGVDRSHVGIRRQLDGSAVRRAGRWPPGSHHPGHAEKLARDDGAPAPRRFDGLALTHARRHTHRPISR